MTIPPTVTDANAAICLITKHEEYAWRRTNAARNRLVREFDMAGYRDACMQREAARVHLIARRRAA